MNVQAGAGLLDAGEQRREMALEDFERLGAMVVEDQEALYLDSPEAGGYALEVD